MDLSPPAASDERIERLRSEVVDVGFQDLASFIDTVATERGFPARCVMVLTRRPPMAAHLVTDREVAGAPLRTPQDLLRARFGAPAGTAFETEHRALLRRLGGPAPDLHVDLSYDEMFDALDAGQVDVVPDYAGIAPRYRRVLGPDRHGMLRYRDCGVRAYGMGFFATGSALERHPEGVATFLQVVERSYRRMRADPEGTVAVAAEAIEGLDRDYTLEEWRIEEEAAIFGPETGDDRVGGDDPADWERTIAWRRDVAGWEADLDAADVRADLPRG